MRKLCRGFRNILAGLLVLLFLFSAASGEAFHPAGEAEAQRKALALFRQCAFRPEYLDGSEGHLIRWENEITLWVGGSPTREDLACLDGFLRDLNAKVPGLPPCRRVRQDSGAALRLWFIPEHMMHFYLSDFVDGNWGFFKCNLAQYRIISARVVIASDVTNQEERNHLIQEELVGALGLPGDHLVYSDSILYERWTTVQSLSEVDWRMLNLLYSPSVSPGMKEEEAVAALKKQQ